MFSLTKQGRGFVPRFYATQATHPTFGAVARVAYGVLGQLKVC
ncbi:hypothetical protein [Emticicia sp. SJ17W-69]